MKTGPGIVRRSITCFVFALVAGMSGGALAQLPPVSVELVTGGLDSPLFATHAGDASQRLFVVEQGGTVRIARNDLLETTPFIDISGQVSCCGERGLLGLAFDPDYAVSGRFYLSYTNRFGDNVLSSWQVSADPDLADAASETILLTVAQPNSNHNGGMIAFGTDGMLYMGVGDGGGSGDPDESGQDLSTQLGKLLRIDVNAADLIPLDNPFVGVAGVDPLIWAYGVRNPWRFSFDAASGDLWMADVGQNAVEEVDFQSTLSSGGENYGWNVLEGSSCFDDSPAGACDDLLNGGSVLPVMEYAHSGGRCSVTGGYVYRGSRFAELDGLYFFGDFCTGEMFVAAEDPITGWNFEVGAQTGLLISSFGEDEAGELYLTHLSSNGELYRVLGTEPVGGIPCDDVLRLTARCRANGLLNAQVRFTDDSHHGENITIAFDGLPVVATVNGSAARAARPAGSGAHTVSLQEPAMCVPDRAVNCP